MWLCNRQTVECVVVSIVKEVLWTGFEVLLHMKLYGRVLSVPILQESVLLEF